MKTTCPRCGATTGSRAKSRKGGPLTLYGVKSAGRDGLSGRLAFSCITCGLFFDEEDLEALERRPLPSDPARRRDQVLLEDDLGDDLVGDPGLDDFTLTDERARRIRARLFGPDRPFREPTTVFGSKRVKVSDDDADLFIDGAEVRP